jgi:dimethylargininase
MAVITRRIPFARRFTASVLSAVAVALVALLATAFLLFCGVLVGSNGADISVLLSLSEVFVYGAIVLFIVVAVFALVGLYQRWYLTLVGAIIAAVLSAFLGNLVRISATGGAISVDALLQPLISVFLPFEVFTVIALFAIGTVIYRRLAADTLLPGERRIAIVRAPAANLAEGELSHLTRSPVDTELADTQWDAYVDALTAADWAVVEVPVGEGMADSVFVEDAAVMFGTTAVITSPGAESRRGETAAVEESLVALGQKIERITLPGTLDGGDVLKIGTTVYVGRGGRTNADGIRQLRSIAGALGYTVVAVPTTTVLHLKSAVTALPDGTVLGYPPLVDDAAIFERFLAVPEEGGAHVVVLSPDTVLMAASAPKSAELIADLGYRVVTVDISEFEKLEGCVTCLSVRLR